VSGITISLCGGVKRRARINARPNPGLTAKDAISIEFAAHRGVAERRSAGCDAASHNAVSGRAARMADVERA